MTPKVALKKQEYMTKFSAYEAPGSESRRMLMNTAKDMFENGKIERFAQTDGLMKLLRDNEMNEFDRRFSKLEAATTARVEKEVFKKKKRKKMNPKDILRVKNKTSELPTLEAQLFNDYTDFESAWKVGHKKLI